MFDRRKLPMILSILLSVLLAAGFLPYSMGLLPMLESLYFNGWWTLLLILPTVGKFLQDGYSRSALALLASGLLLFANAVGKIPAGMLPESILYTALASVAGGTVIELTDRHQKKKYAAALKAAEEQKKLQEAAKTADPFAPETVKRTVVEENNYIPKRAPQQQSKGWTPSTQTQPRQTAWVPPVQTASAPKGWDPDKTYVRPENAKMSTTQPMQNLSRKKFSLSDLLGNVSLALFGNSKVHCKGPFPVSLAVFGDSNVICDNQNITGGLVVSLFGSAKLSLRDADYRQASSVLMFSLFGDTKLEVPYIANVSYTGIPIFGDCKDKRKLVNSDQMPVLSVQSFSIFGGSVIL